LSRIVRAVHLLKSPFPVKARPAVPAPDGNGTVEEAEERARRILEEARTEAARVREQTDREVIERRASLAVEVDQVLNDARELGYREGAIRAREEEQERARATIGLLRRMAEVLFEERERVWREQERQVVEMAVHIAEKVVHREVDIDPDTIVRLAREAIGRVTEREHLVLRIHPDDMAVIEGCVNDLHEEFRNLGQLQVEEDRHVSRGGCIVESRGGYIDATVEGQLHEVRRELGVER